MHKIVALTVLPVVLLAACSKGRPLTHTKEAWDDVSDPSGLQANFTASLQALPTGGHLPVMPWSDTYWPSNLGGVSQRWRQPVANQFAYQSPSADEVRAMTPTQRSHLSPAEKYDIFKGDYSYPTVARERARVSPSNESWEGICHGWAPAALNFAEPQPVAVTGAGGIEVPFGSSDIKALLSYYQGELSDAPSRMIGPRCDVDLAKNPNAIKTHPECKGINAGAFHIALSNLLGLQSQGFVADVAHGNQIWNQPVYGFQSTIGAADAPSPGAAAGTVSEVQVSTTMSYTEEVDPSWSALNGTSGSGAQQINYDYRLELNAAGEIIGGAWIGSTLLDFVWIQQAPTFSDSYYGDIGALYQASQTQTPLSEP